MESTIGGAVKRHDTSTGNSGVALSVLATLFFMWGFCTVLNNVWVPHLKAVSR